MADPERHQYLTTRDVEMQDIETGNYGLRVYTLPDDTRISLAKLREEPPLAWISKPREDGSREIIDVSYPDATVITDRLIQLIPEIGTRT